MKRNIFIILSALLGAGTLFATVGCGSGSSGTNSSEPTDQYSFKSSGPYQTGERQFLDLTSRTIAVNEAAYIPSQCYTKKEDKKGNILNPCYSCHTKGVEPNYLNDDDLQTSYEFPEYALKNRWSNLFKDKSTLISQINDDEILSYVRTNNYLKEDGSIELAQILQNPPAQWDYDQDGKWGGYTPDCYFNFDNEGFDRKYNGGYTGWRAFAYYPFLGTFWPTNGSTDDVLIRLGEIFMQNNQGEFDIDVYKINLSIVESLIKRKDITINHTDENLYGVDLNQNGKLDNSNKIVYKWVAPKYDGSKYYDFSMSYVGKAKTELEKNTIHIAPGLYPENTEFLHTVRYIDLDDRNKTKLSARLKELRYGKKTYWSTYPQLFNSVMAEEKEKVDFPERLKKVEGNSEYGLIGGLGWTYQGFIEDAQGFLRPQTYEESLSCIGCHTGIGATDDGTFAFKRKFDDKAFQKGWSHWSQKGLEGIAERVMEDGSYEFSVYLDTAGGADEFRENKEAYEKFFNEEGILKADEIKTLHADISHLLYPSVQRALVLNKAYKTIVDEQSFIYGRDTVLEPVKNIYEEITDEILAKDFSSYGSKSDAWYADISHELYEWNEGDINASRSVLIEESDLPSAPTHSHRVSDLLLVTESDYSRIAIIDGDTLSIAGRFESGYRAHGYTFSPDGRFAYNLGRDGWLYRYDLYSLKAITKTRVGIDARGIAISNDGKYLIAGLYVPKGAAILDAKTLELIKFIDSSDINSRVCSVNDTEGFFFLAMKEGGEVWKIDYNDPAFGITKATDVGEMLHDGYFSNDNSTYFVASYDYLSAIDTNMMQIKAKLQTGFMPHPGSAATWEADGKKYTSIVHMGEGKNTIFDPDTLEILGNVSASAGGMNPRTTPLMKYVWFDTMFEPAKNEITVHEKTPPFNVVKRITDGIYTLHPEPDADGDYVFVSDWDGNKIRVYDDETLELVKTIDNIMTPTGIFSTSRINENLGH